MEKIESEINKINIKIDDIEQLLEKDFEEWNIKERNKYGNHEQLRKETQQLRKEKQQLRKEKEQLTELLILAEKQNIEMSAHIANNASSSQLSLESKSFSMITKRVKDVTQQLIVARLLPSDPVMNQTVSRLEKMLKRLLIENPIPDYDEMD